MKLQVFNDVRHFILHSEEKYIAVYVQAHADQSRQENVFEPEPIAQ